MVYSTKQSPSGKKKSDLPKHSPPQHLYIHVPLPRKVLLLYSDCCVGTYFPDNFCSCQPVFNHNTPTSHVILFVCPYEISSVFPLPPRDCACIFTSRPLFESAFFSHTCMSHAPYLLFQPFFIAKILANFVVFT